MSLERQTVNVHHESEFHEMPLECGCCSVYIAERISDYPTSDLPQEILLLKAGWHNVCYREKGSSNYCPTHRHDCGIDRVELKQRYNPQNTALYTTLAGKKILWHIDSEGQTRTLATQVEYQRINVQTGDISPGYAELLIQSHLNFGSIIRTESGDALQFTDAAWSFKPYPHNLRAG